MFIYVHCGTLKNPHTIRKEQGMKFPVLWLSFVSLWAWAGAEKGICLAWDLVSRSHITLALRCKSCQKKQKSSYGAAVRQRTVRQETTMARHETLPEFKHQRQCEVAEKPISIAFDAQVSTENRKQKMKRWKKQKTSLTKVVTKKTMMIRRFPR